MNSSIIEDAEHGADCRCNQCLFEGPEVESADELVAKGWLKPEDVERTKPPVVLHRLPDWLAKDDLPDAWQLPRMLPAGAVTLFSADPKCGKTQLMLSLLNSANIGRDVLGERVPLGISVAWLTEEKRPSIRRALRRVGMDFNNLPQDWWIGSNTWHNVCLPAREAAALRRGIVTAVPRVAVVAWGVAPVTACPSAPAVTPCHPLPDVDHTAAR